MSVSSLSPYLCVCIYTYMYVCMHGCIVEVGMCTSMHAFPLSLCRRRLSAEGGWRLLLLLRVASDLLPVHASLLEEETSQASDGGFFSFLLSSLVVGSSSALFSFCLSFSLSLCLPISRLRRLSNRNSKIPRCGGEEEDSAVYKT